MFIAKKYLSRRTFLRSTGATMALPLLEAMIPARVALAQTAATPKPRFMGIFFPHGMSPGYWEPQMEGALPAKLPHIIEWNRQRRAAADRYDALLKDVEGIVMPYRSPDAEHVFHQYTVRVKPTSLGGSADGSGRDTLVDGTVVTIVGGPPSPTVTAAACCSWAPERIAAITFRCSSPLLSRRFL